MMSQDHENTEICSTALVTLVNRLFYYFKPLRTGKAPEKVIVSAEEIARVYKAHKETATASELTVFFEVLKEFGIFVVYIPPLFQNHISNVTKTLEIKGSPKTEDYVKNVIFSLVNSKA